MWRATADERQPERELWSERSIAIDYWNAAELPREAAEVRGESRKIVVAPIRLIFSLVVAGLFGYDCGSHCMRRNPVGSSHMQARGTLNDHQSRHFNCFNVVLSCKLEASYNLPRSSLPPSLSLSRSVRCVHTATSRSCTRGLSSSTSTSCEMVHEEQASTVH